MIANSGHDEDGKYHGGQAGDQTGGEWQVIKWYNRPWNYVLRYPDANVGAMLAALATEAAHNPNIGYDQYQRTTFYVALKDPAVGWHPSNITVKCEADCSAGVAALVIATGHLMGIKALQNVSPDMYTGNERQALKNAGFKVLNNKKYLTSDKYLKPGDILLYEGHHTAINLDYGSEVSPAEDIEKYAVKTGEVGLRVTASSLNVREAPSTSAVIIRSVENGERLFPEYKAFDEKGTRWYYIPAKGGWVSGNYLEGWLLESNNRWWYMTEDGGWYAGDVYAIDGYSYGFDDDGYMKTEPFEVIPDANGVLHIKK